MKPFQQNFQNVTQFNIGESVLVSRRGKTALEEGWGIVSKETVLVVRDNANGRTFAVSTDRQSAMEEGGYKIIGIKPGYIVQKEGVGTKAFTDAEMQSMNPRLSQPASIPVPNAEQSVTQFNIGESVLVSRSGKTALEAGWKIVSQELVLVVRDRDTGRTFAVSTDRESDMVEEGYEIIGKEPGYIVKKEGKGTKAYTNAEMQRMNPRLSQPASISVELIAPHRIEQEPIHPLHNPPWPQIRIHPQDNVSIQIDGQRHNGDVLSVDGERVVVLWNQNPQSPVQRSTFTLDQIQSWNSVSPTAKRDQFKIGEEVYVKKNNSVVERGWSIGTDENNELVVSNAIEFKPFDPSNAYHLHELEMEGNLPNCLKLDEAARIIQKKNEVLEKGSKMTEAEYEKYFAGEFDQGMLGNCFLVSALNSFKMSTHSEAVIRTSVSRAPGGWEVGIPLGTSFDNQTKVFVPDNLVSKPHSQTVTKSDGSRVTLHTMKGPIGWRVLEAAYILHKYHGKFDLAQIDEGGNGDDALIILFGQGVNKTSICNTVKGRVTYEHTFSSGDTLAHQQVIEWLNNFSNGKDIATVSTIHTGDDKTPHYVDEIKFWRSHAYSVKSVDKYQQIVTVVNPHKTSESIILTYDQFMRAFDTIKAVKFDYNNMFRGMTSTHPAVHPSP